MGQALCELTCPEPRSPQAWRHVEPKSPGKWFLLLLCVTPAFRIWTARQHLSKRSPVSQGLGLPERPGEKGPQGLLERSGRHHRAPPGPQMGFVCSHLWFSLKNELFSIGFLACLVQSIGLANGAYILTRPQSATEREPY